MSNTVLTVQQLLLRNVNVLAQENVHTKYTYVGAGPAAGEIETIKQYPTGVASGTRAKLTTFIYDGSGNLIDSVITDTTV